MVGKIGDRLSSYFPDLGKFKGCISDTQSRVPDRTRDDGARREQFASKLTWLDKKQKRPGLADLRKDARIIPTSPHSTLTLADGTAHQCFVIDMSVSGVAVSAQLQPPIGTPLAIGVASAGW